MPTFAVIALIAALVVPAIVLIGWRGYNVDERRRRRRRANAAA